MQNDVKTMLLPEKLPERDEVVLEKYCDDHHGVMRINVTPNKIFGKYYMRLILMSHGLIV
ncbi:MAG: hypothetical protein ABJB76_01635 [Candidatus Nitrosocosmicus sp.]